MLLYTINAYEVSFGQAMKNKEIEDTINQLSDLKLDFEKNRLISISFRKFKNIRPDWNIFPEKLEPFFQDSKNVASYSNGNLFTSEENLNKSKIPVLNDDIAQLAKKQSISDYKALIKPYIGYDLFKPFNGTIPLMSEDLLNTPLPCFEYMMDWETTHSHDNKQYGQNYKYVIISARHHIIDMAMTLFDYNKPRHHKWNCVLLKGKYIVISMDITTIRKTNMVDPSTMSLMDQKRSNSGFEFENLLTGVKKNSNVSNDDGNIGNTIIPSYTFSIVENKLDKDILLLLRSEMDAYNNITKSYSELKCYGPLSMGNMRHRHKLLKTWIQTQLVPDCDVIIGTRENYSGLLIDINRYSREEFYQKLNNRNSTLSRKYNLNVAKEWTKHCVRSIVKLIDMSITKEKFENIVSSAQPFQLIIDNKRNIAIKRLQRIPPNLRIPKKYL